MGSWVICMIFVFAATANSFTILPTTTSPPTTAAPVCMFDGAYYKPGERFQPSPCMFCHCDMKGQPLCAVQDCAPPPCLDAVTEPDQCCPVCPNGANCRASDGTIILQGETYTTSRGAVCRCPDKTTFSFGVNNAMCIVQLEDGTAVS